MYDTPFKITLTSVIIKISLYIILKRRGSSLRVLLPFKGPSSFLKIDKTINLKKKLEGNRGDVPIST